MNAVASEKLFFPIGGSSGSRITSPIEPGRKYDRQGGVEQMSGGIVVTLAVSVINDGKYHQNSAVASELNSGSVVTETFRGAKPACVIPDE